MFDLTLTSHLEQKLTITNDTTNARLTIWFFRSFPIAFTTQDGEEGIVLKANSLGLKEVNALARIGGPDANHLPPEQFAEALQKAQNDLHSAG